MNSFHHLLWNNQNRARALGTKIKYRRENMRRSLKKCNCKTHLYMPVPCAVTVNQQWKWQIYHLTSCNRYAIKLHRLATVQIEVCIDINTVAAVHSTGNFNGHFAHRVIIMCIQQAGQK